MAKNLPLEQIEARNLLLRAYEHRRAIDETGTADPVALRRADLVVRAACLVWRIVAGDPDNAVIDACADVSAGAAQLRVATGENAFVRD